MSATRPKLHARSVTVEVPASSANLGAGYDCLGVALDLTNRVTLEARETSAIELEVEGEGTVELSADRENRFVKGLEAALRLAWGAVPEHLGWRIVMHNAIPLSRGLGSSAAATIGGLLAGKAVAGDVLTTADLLRLATEIEGHPDNASAALLGGFVASAVGPHGVEAVRFDVPRGLLAVLYIPDLPLSTMEMRRAMPASVPFSDAIANLSAVAVGVGGLAAGRIDVLRWLTVDHLHEPYRAAVYPQLPALVSAARDAGALGACLSGAGSTILAFVDSEDASPRVAAALESTASRLGLTGHAREIALRNEAAHVQAAD